MAHAPAAQASECDKFGPSSLLCMAIRAAGELGSMRGTKCGDSLRMDWEDGLERRADAVDTSRVEDMPLPMDTPKDSLLCWNVVGSMDELDVCCCCCCCEELSLPSQVSNPE